MKILTEKIIPISVAIILAGVIYLMYQDWQRRKALNILIGDAEEVTEEPIKEEA